MTALGGSGRIPLVIRYRRSTEYVNRAPSYTFAVVREQKLSPKHRARPYYSRRRTEFSIVFFQVHCTLLGSVPLRIA